MNGVRFPKDLSWHESTEWFKKTKEIRRVLFVCSVNTCRSPAAEYYFNHYVHWWDGLSAKSVGLDTESTLTFINRGKKDRKHPKLPYLDAELEVLKVVGEKATKYLEKHKAKQLQRSHVRYADLILTMEKEMRDILRERYPSFAYKVFTLRGFVQGNDDKGGVEKLQIGNPFVSPHLRFKSGSLKSGKTKGSIKPKYGKSYLEFIKRYIVCVPVIQGYVHTLVKLLYRLKHDQGRVRRS